MNRTGIRVQDLFDENLLRQKVDGGGRVQEPGARQGLQPAGRSTSHAVIDELLSYAARLRPMVADTSLLIANMLDEGRTVVLEGGAGHAARRRSRHLPVRHVVATRPAGGACTGSGVATDSHYRRDRRSSRRTPPASARARSPPSCSTSRVTRLREAGAEFGTTTGRPRRCGWFDAVIGRYAHSHQRCHRLRAHQARRADRPGGDPSLRGLRHRRSTSMRSCRRRRVSSPGPSLYLRDVPRVGART